MSRLVPIACLGFFAGISPAPALAQMDARKLVEQAGAAHGGVDLLAKHPAARVKVKGFYVSQGLRTPYSGESAYHLPDRLHSKLVLNVQGSSQSVEQFYNAGQTALIVAGLSQDVCEAQSQELKMSLYCREIERLAPLLKDPKYILAAVGEKPIQGKPAIGVRVSRAGQKDVTLFFDSNSSLLVGLARQGFDAKGEKVDQLETFSNYRTSGGIKYPAKTEVRQDGQIVLESEVVEFTPLERVDPSAFNVPR